MAGRTDDLLPDSIVQKHLNSDTTDDAGDDPDPADLDESPDDDDALDTSDDEIEDDPEDTDEDESGEPVDEDEDDDPNLDDEDEDEDLEEDDDEDEEEDEDDDDLDLDDEDDDERPKELKDQLPRFDRKKLDALAKKHPELGRAYKHLNALATRATMQAAEVKREGERMLQERDAFLERVQTREGAIEFLNEVVLANPDVVGAAFHEIVKGDDAKDFLVEIGLENPELLREAFERVQELEDDPRERAAHIRDRDTRAREKRIERSEKQRAQEQLRARAREIETDARKFAKRAGIEEEDFTEVASRVRAIIDENGRRTGTRDISRAQIKEAVRAAAKAIRQREERVAARLAARNRKHRQDDTRRRAAKAKRSTRPAPARGAGRRAIPPRRAPEVPAGKDPLDFAIEHVYRRHQGR